MAFCLMAFCLSNGSVSNGILFDGILFDGILAKQFCFDIIWSNDNYTNGILIKTMPLMTFGRADYAKFSHRDIWYIDILLNGI